jgi:L,D-transpeptidase YcbB
VVHHVRDQMFPFITGSRYFVSNDLSSDDLACLVLRVLEKCAPCSKASLVAATGESAGQAILQALLRLEALALIRVDEHEIVITDSGKRFLDDLNSSQSSPCTPITEIASPRGVMRQLFQLAKICHKRAATWIVYVWGEGRSAAGQRGRLILKPALAGRSRFLVFGGASSVLALSIAGLFAWLSSEGVESSRGEPFVLDGTEDSGSPLAKVDRAPPMIDPTENIRIAIIDQLSKPTAGRESHKREQEALVEHYSVPTRPLLWVDENGITDRARFVIKEIAKADEYGLRATDYKVPEPEGFDTVAWLAETEIKIDLAVLRYARDSAGGRINPGRLSKNLSPGLLPDPPEVLKSIALELDPAAYLRNLHPRHPQFEQLRQKLLQMRAQSSTSKPRIVLPEGPVLRKGIEHDQVALLRQRLELRSDGISNHVFDESLDQAVREFQVKHGVTPDGVVGSNTRRMLDQEVSAKENAADTVKERLILINMERWRWLPRDFGEFYVNVNVPEFTARVVREGKVVHAARVVVGTPDKQTPIFSDQMKEIVFRPYWNVPTSIKVEEIRPYLREEVPWFFGGGGWNTSVLQRHGLRVRYGGREVDPGSLDWNRVDIRSLEIFQPPGPDNVLGKIKFVFPNKHDVYLHDTTQKELFAKPVRAESHGCVRVENPEELATIVLGYDQGWNAERVASAIENGYDQHVKLTHTIPVHITYFTLWVNDDGSISNLADIYGHDARMATALFGDKVGFAYPETPAKPRENPVPSNGRAPWDEAASDDIVGSIVRLLQN